MKLFIVAAILLLISSCKDDISDLDSQPPYVTPPDTLNSWKKYKAAPSLNDMVFVDAAKGFLVWSGGFRRSLDSGKTWTDIPVAGAAAAHLFDIKFHDPQFGYALGDSLFHTNDSGKTWTSSAIPTRGYDVFFVSHTTGFLVGQTGLYKTTDAGTNWTGIRTGEWSAIYFKNVFEGWAYKEGGAICKTTDGGDSWVNVVVPFTDVMVFKFSGAFGLASTWGTFMRTTDNGQNWQTIPGFDGGFIDIDVLSLTMIYATAGKRIRKSTDGANTWTTEVGLGTEQLISVHFIDALHGWAGTTGGHVLRFVKQ